MTAQHSVGPRLTRRAALIASLGSFIVLATGCRAGDDQPSTTTSSAGAAQQTTPANPLGAGPTDRALAAVSATRLFVQSVGAEYPRLKTRTDRVAQTHMIHEEFLQALLGPTPTPAAGGVPQVPPRRAAAERALAARESDLAKELADLAVTAEDGPLARALASLSAGTSQISTSAGWETDPAPAITLPESPSLSADETVAVQDVLEREHASLWWYAVLGGRTSAVEQPGLFPQLQEGYAAHRQQRDELTALMFDQGLTPVAAEPAYPIDWNLRWRSRNAKEVHRIEHEAAAAYSWLVAESTGELRTWAVIALRNAAIRDLVVQGTPENFPGADELADH